MRKSVEIAVKNRIIEHGPGWCFTSVHFSDLGSDASIRKALSSLQKQDIIRRLTQGVYDYPEVHHLVGIVPPSLDDVARAIAEKNGVQIQHERAYAANLIHLCNQVPAKTIFLTEGPSREVKIGNQKIIFIKTTKKIMSSTGTREGLLIQALKTYRKKHIDRGIRIGIADFLKTSPEQEIKKNMKFAPAWMRNLVSETMELATRNELHALPYEEGFEEGSSVL